MGIYLLGVVALGFLHLVFHRDGAVVRTHLLQTFRWRKLTGTASNAYCHPMYAQTMDGFGVDPDAPRLPFVTVTVLSRPFRWLSSPMDFASPEPEWAPIISERQSRKASFMNFRVG